ncbi:MAG: DNA-protecting protein DprA [candidate division NC10 bacterium]|nr:DNA-protecting protein DprA [candidate division NC10 bacterium]
MEEREALVALALLPELPAAAAAGLLARFGGARGALAAPGEALAAVPGVPRALAARLRDPALVGHVGRELTRLEALGGIALTLADPAYPPLLREIPDPPPALFVRGRLPPPEVAAVAVVGARQATPYGRMAAERLAHDLARAGLAVVSGFARGIDAAAHRGALKAGGLTVAVLGCGLDVIYPAGSSDLAERVIERGARVSEFPLGTRPLPVNFPRRNRIISGLTRGTVVVEAGERSGALVTARCALEQGREVFAVPGPVTAPTSVGANRLIKAGAKLTEDWADVMEELFPAWVRPAAAPPPALPEELPDEARVIWAVLAGEPTHIDTVASRTALSPGRVAVGLLALEMAGFVRQLPGQTYVRAADQV